MPILVGPTTAAPDRIVARPTPRVSPGAARWSWTAQGTVRDLSAGLTYLRPGGVAGHLAAPRTVIQSSPPGLPGGVHRGDKYEPRDVALGLLTNASDTLEWKREWRALIADFDGDGVLAVQHADGDTRMLSARYIAGLESSTEGDLGTVTIGSWAVQLRAYDPWWYGPAQRRTFQPAVTGGFPWPPIVVQSTELIGSGSVVTNPGDVEAFPVWTLTGPLSEVTATAENGASWTVTKTLGPGESVTVDTDPRAPAFQRVTDFSGSNLWGIATPDYPDLWPLPAGDSTVTVAVSGASSATRIHMDFNPRYRTA